ncbi:MAG: flagellin [Peptostreptococcaceae bacterium]|nr:flagellin [Peptostreptococcaceae bacterium]
MRIQHNISALNSHRQLGNNNSAIGKNLEKLSSGFKINKAGDDAAGLAISEKMRAQIKGLETAQKNAQDGISLVQTAEGALTEVHSMLNRMVELATQSANGTYDDKVDRENLQKEVASLKSEIDRISESTNFNGINLLDGSMKSKELGITPAAQNTDATGATSMVIKGGNLDATDTQTFKFTVGAAGTEQADATLEAVSPVGGGTDKVTFERVEAETKLQGAAGSGSITFRAKVNKAGLTGDNLKNVEKYEGMTITVNHGKLVGGKNETSKQYDSVKSAGLKLQVGDTNASFQKVEVSVDKMDSAALGIGGVDISDQSKAGDAVKNIKDAINKVSSTRGDLGAIQNRLEHTINNLGVTTENMTAAESRIRDVDMAKEMMEFTKNNILSQAATSMLAQANQTPQGVLQLLN